MNKIKNLWDEACGRIYDICKKGDKEQVWYLGEEMYTEL